LKDPHHGNFGLACSGHPDQTNFCLTSSSSENKPKVGHPSGEYQTRLTSTTLDNKTRLTSSPLENKARLTSSPLENKTRLNSSPLENKTKLTSSTLESKTRFAITPSTMAQVVYLSQGNQIVNKPK
jgi:hypothetical protein